MKPVKSQLAQKSRPTSGRQQYDVATSYRCWPDVGLTFLAGWDIEMDLSKMLGKVDDPLGINGSGTYISKWYYYFLFLINFLEKWCFVLCISSTDKTTLFNVKLLKEEYWDKFSRPVCRSWGKENKYSISLFTDLHKSMLRF